MPPFGASGPLVDRCRRALLALLTAIAAVIVPFSGCSSRSTTTPEARRAATRAVPIMGASRLSAAQIVAWVKARQPQPPGAYAASVPVERLAQLFIEEGTAEGVAGDIAFMQSVIETGWFRFTGAVPSTFNNFGGIGATDPGGPPAAFPDARTGIRAQIQHLRAYADPSAVSCAVPPLAFPCVDPRFHLVFPKGRVRTWNDLGGGNWASARGYGLNILSLYNEALRSTAADPAERRDEQHHRSRMGTSARHARTAERRVTSAWQASECQR